MGTPHSGTISAVLFDFGGTLDGDGHWLDRFYAIYPFCGAPVSERVRIKDAFYEADRQLEADPAIRECGYRAMMRLHAGWQLRHLGIVDEVLADSLARAFAVPAEAALRRNRKVLQRLRDDGYRLGVVSNFYGNVAALCEEAGLAPLLDIVMDSAIVGLRKPDPRLFVEALSRLGVEPGRAAMVGDSFDRDIRPARAIGMHTFWLAPGREAVCPDPSLVDGVLQTLDELPGHLSPGVRS